MSKIEEYEKSLRKHEKILSNGCKITSIRVLNRYQYTADEIKLKS